MLLVGYRSFKITSLRFSQTCFVIQVCLDREFVYTICIRDVFQFTDIRSSDQDNRTNSSHLNWVNSEQVS